MIYFYPDSNLVARRCVIASSSSVNMFERLLDFKFDPDYSHYSSMFEPISNMPSSLTLSRRRKYFCAWLLIWLQVLVPICSSISRQSLPNFLRPSRNLRCSPSVHRPPTLSESLMVSLFYLENYFCAFSWSEGSVSCRYRVGVAD